MRRLAAAVLGGALAAVAAAGCGTQDVLLGAHEGYLLLGYDALALPGEQVVARARLLGGNYLAAQKGETVRFYRSGTFHMAAATDDEGVASVPFTPAAPGEYPLQAEVSPVHLEAAPPPPATVLVACRKADTPQIVIDLDKTLVASGFHEVLAGDPEPMTDSAAVMARLAERYAPVYLTHRPDYFGRSSKQWLRTHGYPRGPLLLSTVGGFLKGSREYKTGRLAELGRRFTALEIGVGDKVGDAQAYYDNGLTAVLILQIDPEATAEDLRDQADSLDALATDVHVVTGWRQVEALVFQDKRFPRPAMQERLREWAARRASEEDDR